MIFIGTILILYILVLRECVSECVFFAGLLNARSHFLLRGECVVVSSAGSTAGRESPQRRFGLRQF